MDALQKPALELEDHLAHIIFTVTLPEFSMYFHNRQDLVEPFSCFTQRIAIKENEFDAIKFFNYVDRLQSKNLYDYKVTVLKDNSSERTITLLNAYDRKKIRLSCMTVCDLLDNTKTEVYLIIQLYLSTERYSIKESEEVYHIKRIF